MSVDCKKIRERVTKMNTAWAQGAPKETFRGIKQADFQAKIQNAAAIEQECADLQAQLRMRTNDRDAIYSSLTNDSVNVREGVEGHEDYGKNHPLYEGMGFTLESDRASGLTRKKKTEKP